MHCHRTCSPAQTLVTPQQHPKHGKIAADAEESQNEGRRVLAGCVAIPDKGCMWGVGAGGLCVCLGGPWLVRFDEDVFQARKHMCSNPVPQPLHPAGDLKKIGTMDALDSKVLVQCLLAVSSMPVNIMKTAAHLQERLLMVAA